MDIEYVLQKAWDDCLTNHGIPTERQFLRQLHSQYTLNGLEMALNHHARRRRPNIPLISVTSIWVDHTPQCWFGPPFKPVYVGGHAKNSCELGDLLIVIWDNNSKQTGLAWLIQGKVGRTYNRINQQGSTKIERYLLENGPRFTLSNQTSIPRNSNHSRLNYIGNPNGYCLDFLTSNSHYEYCCFLQMKHALSKRWPSNRSQFQVVWPLNFGVSYSFGGALLDATFNPFPVNGRRFTRHSKSDDWNALVNLLLDETLISSRTGTAKGALQINSQYMSSGRMNSHITDSCDLKERSLGIPIIEITKQTDGEGELRG